MPKIIIERELYDRLLLDQKILMALVAGGVDNWEWYGESLKQAGLLDDEEEA